jgi:hypothetical protein
VEHELAPDRAVSSWSIATLQRPSDALAARLALIDSAEDTIDRAKSFLGSVNLDPRSKLINTEMGVLIDDDALGGQCADAIIRLMDTDNAWHWRSPRWPAPVEKRHPGDAPSIRPEPSATTRRHRLQSTADPTTNLTNRAPEFPIRRCLCRVQSAAAVRC